MTLPDKEKKFRLPYGFYDNPEHRRMSIERGMAQPAERDKQLIEALKLLEAAKRKLLEVLRGQS